MAYLQQTTMSTQPTHETLSRHTYPTLCPCPFSFSTRMSNTSSPVDAIHFTLHQFRAPITYLLFGEPPVVSLSKIGIFHDEC